ncbi:Cochaperone protein [Balamuthia mandrillaris]
MSSASVEAFQQGCSLFVDEAYEEALQSFNRAIEAEGETPQAAEYYLKRSACHSKLKNLTEAVADANKATQLNPQNSKAYLRKGMACFALDEYETALAAFEKGQQLEPENASFKTWIRKCKAEIESEEGLQEDLVTEEATAPPSQAASSSSSVAPAPTSTPATSVQEEEKKEVPQEPKVRHSWYQNPTHVYITFYAKGLKEEDVQLELTDQSMDVTIKLPDSDWVFDIELCDKIVPSESRKVVNKTNVEIKLKKANTASWTTLERKGETRPWADTSTANKHNYPSSSKHKKNWDVLAKEAEEEKLEGEQALNKVFRDIYSNGTEEQRRAMMKSFLESGGTVLSTNWEDVGKRKVECTPPEGLEVRRWNDSK